MHGRISTQVARKVFHACMMKLGFIFFSSFIASTACGQGAIISAAGPVNRSMGSASTAAPLSALSALYNNPATISGMERNELEVGLDLLFSDHTIESEFGGLSGSTDSDNGAFPIPNVGWVLPTEDPRFTFGLSITSMAGLKTNVPSDTTNPALLPAPTGLGMVSSEATFLQISPVISYALGPKLSIAAGPNITLGQLAIDPFVFDSANANGTYSSGRASQYHWGGGFTVGAYMIGEGGWHYGVSLKSPAWMETFKLQGVTDTGTPRTLEADLDLPLILSAGTAYNGFENWIIAADFRWIDYANADGFGDPATFRADGSVPGVDFDSVFVLALGVQRQLTDRLYFRTGYTYNENPIDDENSFFNVASPLVYEHIYSLGGTLAVNKNVAVNVAYSHYFENEVTGPIINPTIGAVPGSSITNRLSADFISFGVLMKL
ncbi:MAG: outer membrane protein transport protein [Planctomycetota bacterium]